MRYKIKEIREKKRYSQEELAQISGVSRQTISKMESGEEVAVLTSTLAAIADALGVSIRSLFLP